MAKQFRIEPTLKKQLENWDTPNLIKRLENEGLTPALETEIKKSSHDSGRLYALKEPESIKPVEKFLKDTTDNPSLTDELLQERKEALESLYGTTQKGINWQNIEARIRGYIQERKGLRNPTINVEHVIGQTLESLQRGVELQKFGNFTDESIRDIYSFYQDELDKIETGKKGIEEIGRIKDIQTGRAEKASRTGEFQDFLTTGEAESEAFASEFLKRQQERGADVLSQELAPDVAQQLQKRGLLDSGEFGATISNLGAQIQSGIEQEYISQRDEDIAFWADMGFKAKFQELIDADKEVAGQIASERQTIRQGQQQRYAKREGDIQSRFNIDLFRRENERALQDYKQKTTRQLSKQREQSQAQQIGNIAQTATQGIGTGFLLKKFG